mgnify:CR=1 FL=1
MSRNLVDCHFLIKGKFIILTRKEAIIILLVKTQVSWLFPFSRGKNKIPVVKSKIALITDIPSFKPNPQNEKSKGFNHPLDFYLPVHERYLKLQSQLAGFDSRLQDFYFQRLALYHHSLQLKSEIHLCHVLR